MSKKVYEAEVLEGEGFKTKIMMFQHPEAAPQAQKWRNDRNPGRPTQVALSP